MLVTKIETRICKKAIMKKIMGIHHTSFLQKNKIAVVHFEFQREVY